MMHKGVWLTGVAMVLLGSGVVLADDRHVDCDRGKSLARAVAKAKPGETITVRGLCREAVTITTDRLTLDGGERAVIDGGGQVAVTVDGARGITLMGFPVRNGTVGLLVQGGASAVVRDTTVQGHGAAGIRVDGHASLELTNCTTQNNAVHGLEVDRASEVKIAGRFSHSRRRPILLKTNDLSHLVFVNIKSIESITYAFYVAGNRQVF